MSDVFRPPDRRIRVGEFVVDPRSGELCGEAGRQMLPAQPLQLLLALAERPGVVVPRDELRARLWPADTYVDFEHGLNAVAKRLRDVLGDSAEAPRYIETVPRRGYRLIAPLQRLESAPPATTDTIDAVPPIQSAVGATRVGGRLVPVATAAAVALFAIAGTAYVADRWRLADAAADVGGLTRLTFGPGLQTNATWSPDGRRIAFAADRDGNFDLFRQSLDGGDPVRITGSPANETQPAWSPDGQRLVFRSDEDGGGLFTVSVDGGPIRRIASTGFRPVWMPDGSHVLFADAERHLRRLWLVSADGGSSPREILTDQLEGGTWMSYTVHPDGRIGLLGIHPVTRAGFYVSDRDHRVLTAPSGATSLPGTQTAPLGRARWSKAGDAVFVEAIAEGVPGIWRVPVDPVTQAWRTPARLTTAPVSATEAAISPDGTRVAFTNGEHNTRAWVFPFDADRRTPPGEGRAVTDDDASIGNLTASADGTAIFYAEGRPGRSTVRGVRMDLATGASTVLVDNVASGLTPSPTGSGTAYVLGRPRPGSPATDVEYTVAWRQADGRELLLSPWSSSLLLPTDVRRDDRALLGTMMVKAWAGSSQLAEWPIGPSPATQPSRVLLAADGAQFWQGRYSPDGRWVSFVAVRLDAFGTLEIGIAPAGSDRASTWTRIAADHEWPDKPRWSPDGRTLYFLSRSASGFLDLWGIPVDPARGAAAGVAFRMTTLNSPRWHIDPHLKSCELGIAKGRLVLPMRSVKGSIWLSSRIVT